MNLKDEPPSKNTIDKTSMSKEEFLDYLFMHIIKNYPEYEPLHPRIPANSIQTFKNEDEQLEIIRRDWDRRMREAMKKYE